MTKAELKTRLEQAGVSPQAYTLDGGFPNESYTLSQEPYGRWDVYYSERGLKNGLRSFDSESAACEFLWERIQKDRTAMRP